MTYTLTRSRRKTLAIYVKPDGSVEVRAPLRMAKFSIERFVASKSLWIERKQKQLLEKRQEPPRELPPLQYSEHSEGGFESAARSLIAVWEQRLGVTASFIGFRSMTSRWGSCTAATRRIRINNALAYCPRECLEYVIVHELAHLLECNHSPRFWSIVAGALPDYKARQKKLKAMSWLLGVLPDRGSCGSGGFSAVPCLR